MTDETNQSNGKKNSIKKRDNPWYVATMLLSVRPRSISEMRKRLSAKGFSGEEVEKTIEQCKKFGYLDDTKFAAAVCNAMLLARPVGKRLILQKLRTYGLDNQTIENALAGCVTPDQEMALAEKALLKKKGQLARAGVDKKLWYRKLGQFLAGRGFSSETIMAALEKIGD